ncbi:hypothetical protein [Parvularcula maris]|uniref:Response regulatory domain-containing protein n=1 Tax=Parvularcula maris TaxID=2965077 RepID=A0A9X2LAK9_9PROT|nr:hypothetical protein [Parvularcula maris]MCQ8186186.1 hypothetical protein [Parvularcula maris]
MHRSSLSGLKILLIEGDPIVALDLAGTLEDAGASVFLALNAAEGYDLADRGEAAAYDLAILDTKIGRNGLLSLAAKLENLGTALAFYTAVANRYWLAEQFPESLILSRQHDSDVFLSSLQSDFGAGRAYLN